MDDPAASHHHDPVEVANGAEAVGDDQRRAADGQRGEYVTTGAPGKVLTEEVLSALYDAPIRVGRHEGRPLVLHHA